GAMTIEDHRVMVIRHGAREDDLDATTLSGLCEAVGERVIGFLVGTQQELPLRAATRDHVETARNDGAWEGHGTASGRAAVSVSPRSCPAIIRIQSADL